MITANKKIVKNTTYLYLRMFISMGITFYTSRVILENLGIEDYGIYNVVGGLAVLFSFLNNSLASSTQRYLTYALGQGDQVKVVEVFSASVTAHLGIAMAILFASEPIGLYLIYHKLDIPAEVVSSAMIVFQFSLLSCIISIINVPYNAALIADERFGYFAIVGLAEATLRLIVAYLIILFPNRLQAYALLLSVVSLMTFSATRLYCRMELHGMVFRRKSIKRKLLKDLASFTGWHMVRNASMMGVTQANSILANVFGGPVASAAVGIYTQLTSGVNRFMSSVQSAFAPQITKSYSCHEVRRSVSLMSASTKLSSLLYFAICLPLCLNIEFILSTWLKEVPEYTTQFCVLGLIALYFEALSVPSDTLIMAAGRIKRYELISSAIFFISIPIAYIFLKIGWSIKYLLIFRIIASLAYVIYESIEIHRQFKVDSLHFLLNSIVSPFAVGAICYAITYVSIPDKTNDFYRFIQSTILSLLILGVFSWFFLLRKSEKNALLTIVKLRKNE